MLKLLRLVFLLSLGIFACTKQNQYPNLPMKYPRATNSLFKSFDKYSEYVRMADGIKIATDIFLPTQGPDQTRFPVIFSYTPYQRARIDRKTGEITDESSDRFPRLLLSHGYAVVIADMRGTGASTGWLMDFMPEIWSDGKAVIDWIAAQPWCDENIGMMGGSYLGWSQTATASQRPKALKCIMPAVVPLEGYTGEVYPGGIYLDGFMKSWSHYMYYSERNYYLPDLKVTAAPVTDEDGDGELLDEIPLDLNGDGSFLDEDFPPTYSDQNPRQHIYYNLTLEHHKKNYDYTNWASELFFYDGKSPLGYRVDQLGPTAHVHGIMESKIPIYNIGGWFDGFARGTFELFATMKKSNPSKIIMGPGYHNVMGGPFWKFFGYDKETVRDIYQIEHLRFFDYYLKGIDNGIDSEPPILIYVMNGKGWRFENEWPLKREKRTKFYLGPQNRLQITEAADGQVNFKPDYSHSSAYGKNKGNRWLGIGGNEPDALPYRTDIDLKTLSFETKPLLEDMEVTGHPIVNLSLSSTADYGDFFIYLEDVDEDGQSLLVTEGQLRAGFARLYNNDDMIQTHNSIDVQPDLPWHGFNRHQYIDKIFDAGKPVQLTIDLHPTSWNFKSGHRLKVSIACSDHPTFRLHPKLCPTNDPNDPANIVPTVTVYFGASTNACIDLPVIPNS